MRLNTRTVLGFLLALTVGAGVLFALPTFAQEASLEQMESFGELAGFTTQADITVIIARLIRTAISFLGVIVVVLILYGGFMYMTAGGDEDRIKKAKKILTNAVIGLVLVFSSFAIVSFILNALVDATGSRIDTEDVTYDGFDDGSRTSVFYLRSVNTDCASSLQNLVLQFVFSYSVDEDTVEDGILIKDDGGDIVDGTFEVSGRTVTFTPSRACDSPYETYFCFEAESDYTISLDDTVLKSSSGRSLRCSVDYYSCEEEFTTGTGVDIASPTVAMDAPDDGDRLYVGDPNELLQAQTNDDTGVSTVYFYVIDDDSPIYTSGTDLSSAHALLGGGLENYFSTDTDEEWNTSGYTTNERYDIWAKGIDCAGNYDVADRIEILLRAANCNNAILDPDYEDDINCGGDESSPYYCGACEGDACYEDEDCAEGICEEGICVSVPKIERVSPDNGAVMSLVTIAGEGFGDDEGTVTFLATESGDSVEVGAYTCNSVTQWSDDEIVVQVPATLTADGSLMVTTTEPRTDRTDDDYGPTISDFDVNAIERPGICMLDPDEEQPYRPISVYGNNFGTTQGSSTFYFTSYEANTYESWGTDTLSVTVPNANAGHYWTSVFTGDYVCLDTLDEPTGETCSTDSDCHEELGETCATKWCSETLEYCEEGEDCVDQTGTCESIRVGSNEVLFSLEDVSSNTTPIISSIETGWTACQGGDHDGEHCAIDEDCEGSIDGTCEAASNWGPPGQYVTIYGTNFGSAEGYIKLASRVSGNWGYADTEFPEFCDSDFWHDTSITVKIPEIYQGELGAIEFVTHDLQVIRQDSQTSDSVELVVLDDEPGPSVCGISPSAGPVGTSVTLLGERFGIDTGGVMFYSEADADLARSIWDDVEISLVPVPADAVTGPVYVVDNEGYQSNSMSFAVGNCNEDITLCSEGKECCADGSCSALQCLDRAPVDTHFSYMISTATIPATPEVLVRCDLQSHVISPSVWEGWTEPDETCLNSILTATFNMKMDTSSLSPENITVEKCILFDEDYDVDFDTNSLNDVCVEWEELTASSFSTTDYLFEWYPPLLIDEYDVDNDGDVTESIAMFEPNTLYHVTLNGSGEAGAIRASVVDQDGAYMDGDFEWEFSTGEATQLCEVGAVNLTPYTHVETEENADVSYIAQLVSASDECQVLSCAGYTLTWASDYYGAVIDELVKYNVCLNTVRAEHETLLGIPAEITSTVNATNNPTDEAYLTIDFTDPEVSDYFPNCTTACINAMPWAEFNTDMDWSTINEDTVTLYQCEDSLCTPSEVDEFEHVSSIYHSPDDRLEIQFVTGYTMLPNTYYRIVLDGDSITSQYDIPLSRSGSNFDTVNNQHYENDFSWIFKTKDSEVSCTVDSVDVLPDPAMMSYVGEREEFGATAYGAPDDCDADGQALQGSSYTWSTWTATDTPDIVFPPANFPLRVTAIMLEHGEIKLSNNLPDWCSSACTNVGSAAQYGDPVCGDTVVDLEAEECDDGNTVDDDGCSSICLLEGSDACTYACVASSRSCVSDTDCQEDCVSNVCTISEAACATDDGSDCPYYVDTCQISNLPCCGDGSVQSGVEECDDRDSDSGDGCSSSCLNEGSRSVFSTCGDSSVAQAADIGGEDCDDGNRNNGDGCSSICLHEGGISIGDVYSVCGDNNWEDDKGEDCDDNNLVDGDGCSSWCLHEGTEQCVWVCENSGISCSVDDDCDAGESCVEYGGEPCCGNSIVERGEDCDGGQDGEDGCSNECLLLGSSAHYDVYSFCGDGYDAGTGEECDVVVGDLAVQGYGVGQVTLGASQEVQDGYAISTISVFAGDDDPKEGTATLMLECSCETNFSCGRDATIGCGLNGCCFTRPRSTTQYPPDNFVAGMPPAEGYCRNTAIYADFDQEMDLGSFDLTEDLDKDGEISTTEFDSRFYLKLTNWDGVSVVDSATCPSNYIALAFNDSAPRGFFARAWSWVKSKILALFGHEAEAADATSFGCYVPVSFTASDLADDAQRVYVRYSSLLEENSTYQLVILADSDRLDTIHSGVLGVSQTDLCKGVKCEETQFSVTFFVGDEICTLDYVGVEDTGRIDAESYESASEQFFTETDEQHGFIATSYSYRTYSGSYEQISPIAGVYDWDWAWTSSITDGESSDVVSLPDGEAGDDTDSLFAASGNDGDETVIASAIITDDIVLSPSTEEEVTSGTIGVEALLCENPWPALDALTGFPYIETNENTNFSFYYCRDYGDDGTEDDLPALEDPIEVYSLASSNILQELIFKVEDESDAVGVRVIPNPEYLSPSAWVEGQEFTGSFGSTIVDGYEAVESGTTTYVVAANEHNSTLYSNVYILSYNSDADEESVEIFSRILDNWSFNANVDDVTDVNLCKGSTGYITDDDGNYTECSWDGGCFETCDTTTQYCQDYADVGDECESASDCDSNTCTDGYCTSAEDVGDTCTEASDCDSALCYGTCSVTGDYCSADSSCPLSITGSPTCDAEKAKLTHDMKRLTDITDTIALFEEYGSSNMYCSITTDEQCFSDDDCPGTETCLEHYPDVQSGTFVPAISNSIWGSWNSVLSNAVGSTLATDPINEFYNCSTDGYDTTSCWNGVVGTFICPEKSLLYGYQSTGGQAYTLYGGLEYPDALWSEAIDTDLGDDVTVVLEYATDLHLTGTPQSGFTNTPQFCDGTTWGDSIICGDGVQGTNEICEIDDTSAGGFCGSTDNFSACTSVADCPNSGTCYTGSCTVCVNADDDTYDGVEGCTVDTECGIGGTCANGTNSYVCINNAGSCIWDTTNVAACIAFECGNGAVEDGEICDDGSLNGTYGHCGDDCKTASDFYCGDGYLASGEECDCGSTGLYNYSLAGDACNVSNDPNSWACFGSCDNANGQYITDITSSCAFNCTAPGPACGDGYVNGGEDCDGDYETHAGGLCSDGATACDTNSDCDGIGTEVCGATYAACGLGDVCVDFDDAGDDCDDNSDCDSGTCSNGECTSATDIGTKCNSATAGYVYGAGFCQSMSCPDMDYELYRYRVCGDDCQWPTSEDGYWSYCVGGDQQCGNGTVEGNEECDDGNDSNNDYCLNTCELNVCGDDYVYTGVESCDNGDDNGELCDAAYGRTCNYCNELCQYKTRSGAYCGDGITQPDGGEICDGDDIAYGCFDTSTGERLYGGSCDSEDAGAQGDCEAGYTCRKLGTCNGGSYNGERCTATSTAFVYGSYDVAGCTAAVSGDVECVFPECADDCRSQCPTSYQSVGILGQVAGSEDYTDTFDLYSYNNDEEQSPDHATLFVPACRVATALTANVSNADVELPDVDIVFVTDLSGSMARSPDCTEPNDGDCPSVSAPNRRIDYVVDATMDAIEEMLDVYDGIDATMRIGLVSYHNSSAADDLSEIPLESLINQQSSLMTVVEAYTGEIGGGTPTEAAVDLAVSILDTYSSTDALQFVILLSDGAPSSISDVTDVYDDIRSDLHSHIIFFSATLSINTTLQAYMAHMSDETCGTTMDSLSDCTTGTHTFTATSADGVSNMYEAIVDSIIHTTVSTTSNSVTTTDQVEIGEGAVLPFPEGFVCTEEEQTIPIRNVFYGTGTMSFSNFEFTYCPYE